jgi:hypothetical protein
LQTLAAQCWSSFSHQAQDTLAQAQRICRHEFDLLGYERLQYGSIDWHLDAVNGKRAPLRPWYKISYLDFDQVGDAKVIWELNRLQHLVCLSKAFVLTRDERYPEEVKRQIASWTQQNTYPYGINWASSLEVAFRALSLLWVEHLLADSASLDDEFWGGLRQLLAVSGRHISRYLSTYFSPNTHLLGEAVALFFIGTLHTEFPDSGSWKRRGWEIVLREAARQVRPDGMHFEQSMYYHVYALDFFLHARILAARNGMIVPADFDEVLGRMLAALAVLAQGGSANLAFGDDDGGRLFDPRRNKRHHMTDPLGTGAVLFARPDCKAVVETLCEETLWLLGSEAVANFSELASEAPPPRSVALASSGLYVMWGRDHQLVMDAGSQGEGRAGHGHADALSLSIAVGGEPWLVDPGAFVYVGAGREREMFRGTEAHNTLQVDGCSQSEPLGPFAWDRLPNVSVISWRSSDHSDLLIAEHDGYSRLPQPVIHRRWAFHRKSKFCLVRDVATGDGQHQLDLRWHLAPGLAAEVAGHSVRIQDSGGQCLNIQFLATNPWSCQIDPGWISPAYGAKQPISVVHLAATSSLPAENLTLIIFPSSEPVARPFSALGSASSVRGYSYAEEESQHYFFFSDSRDPWQAASFSGDARFTYCEVSDGEILIAAILDGTTLTYNNASVIANLQPVAWHEFNVASRVGAN